MSEPKQEFRRSLSLLDGTLLVSGSMIGSGIFIVSAEMSRAVGSAGWLIFLWLLTGVMTIFAGLSYGELAGMMPKAGGQFVYIKRAWGDLTAFLYGWSVATVIQTGTIAAVAMAFAKYTGYFIEALSPTNILLDFGHYNLGSYFGNIHPTINAAQIFAMASIVLLTFLNSKGINYGKIMQLIFTSAKLIALFALIVLGLIVGSKMDFWGQNFTDVWAATNTFQAKDTGAWVVQNISGMTLVLALGTAIIGSLFSSDAWNNVTFIAGEMKNPRRDIPLSLLLGTVIVTTLYILANLAYLALLPLKGDPNAMDAVGRGVMFALDGRVGTAAASQIFGGISATLMSLLIIISTFGCNSGLILSGARVYYAMSKEGLFFKKAAELNKNDVPGFALWVQCIWASLLCLSGTYSDLLDYATFVSLIYYCVTIAGIFVLRKKDPDAERPYKVPGYPITPIIYILLALSICLILLYTKTGNTGRGLLIIAIGVPFYFMQKRGKISE
jgi:basic amino acid/polyamine antiporter, APA family